MAPSRSIAVAQTCPVAGDVPANLQDHVRLARLAAAEGARVVVFPELSLTGYELELAGGLAFSEDDARLSPLLDLAAALGVTLVVGGPVRLGPSLHIGAFLLHPDQTSELYTKHRLGAFPPAASCDSDNGTVPPAEAAVFQPGDRNPLVRLGGHLAAVAVCADIGNPAHPRRAAEQGADTYLASMFVITSDFEGEALRLSRYAVQHRMLTALANFGGPSSGLRSGGRSSIWSETGELLVQLEGGGSGIAVVTETPEGRRTRAVMVGDSAGSWTANQGHTRQ
jgi:predicted amidohydrolase